ncbi:hypothetical protein MSAN_00777800 [Mycena sanguinolenta]|uniref:Uncharacterized protein n=1 Tax=Mycena sanguinolenta TaxID=230812 RepID=A0A8H7DHB6_9AGAR|nr:hypothetical protein MSAN_00777800 [Mycena sanguinolenta]
MSSSDVPSSDAPDASENNAVTQSVMQKLTHSLLTKTTKKRKNTDGDDPQEEETYKSYGRHLVRTCGPFERIHVIAEHGVREALRDEDKEPPHHNTKEQQLHKRLEKSWSIITETIPGFREDMIQLGGNRRLRKKVCQEIQAGVDAARGDDTSKMKTAAIDWLMKIQDPSVPIPSADIPDRHKKAGRGFNNALTAEVLRPMEYPALDETYEKIKAGDKLFSTNGKIPAFLYPKDHIYNEHDIEDKVLEGPLPIAAAKQIYQGPSAALQAPGYHRGRAGNAARNGQDALGARDVAYVCTQLYCSLSSLSNWAANDGNFSYEDFYWAIADLFEDGEGQDIIDNFNYHVFGTPSLSSAAQPADLPAALSGFDLVAAQRAAKRARLATGPSSAS